MILPDHKLKAWAVKGGVFPYDAANVNPASIDLRVGGQYIDLLTGTEHTMTSLTIVPGDAILATTIEYVKIPSNCIGTLYLKSSLARQGLDHALAGLCDCGFSGTLTLELHSHRPITIYAGQRIIQLVLQYTAGEPEHTYSGRYQHQTGPTMAREDR